MPGESQRNVANDLRVQFAQRSRVPRMDGYRWVSPA